jgi:hypothetical protein
MSPMIWLRETGAGGLCWGGSVVFRSVPGPEVLRCGQCRWLHSSLRVSPAAAGGHGAGPRQKRRVRRGQSEERPRRRGGGAE